MTFPLDDTSTLNKPTEFNNLTSDNTSIFGNDPLDHIVAGLLANQNLEAFCSSHPEAEAALNQIIEDRLNNIFIYNDETAKYEIFQSLFSLYEATIAYPLSPESRNHRRPLLANAKRLIEDRWTSELTKKFDKYTHTDTTDICQAIKAMWEKHPSHNHKLFQFFRDSANLPQLAQMFRSDWALNIRFYDLLVLAMVGCPLEAREELSKNFWDEAGRGDASQSHVRLFNNVLERVGQKPGDVTSEPIVGWQGLEGFNLFYLFATNREHYFKLLGVMAATELLDPLHYDNLVAGCRRLGLEDVSISYYTEHASIDIEHANGWLENVIRPLVKKWPDAQKEILLGVAMRLDSACVYYDTVYENLLKLG